MQKTYHHQTGKFLATIAQSMPEISADVMQGWIENPKGLKKVLAGALCPPEPTSKWREEDGVIYFSVESDGTTGKEWIGRLKSSGSRFGFVSRELLLSKDFRPTCGIKTEVAVLKGMLFEDNNRDTENIRVEAYAGTFTRGQRIFNPNAEVACLLREKFTDKEIEAMGLWRIVTMHEPLILDDDHPRLLVANRDGIGSWFDTRPSGYRWDCETGFAFSVSQVSSQS